MRPGFGAFGRAPEMLATDPISEARRVGFGSVRIPKTTVGGGAAPAT